VVVKAGKKPGKIGKMTSPHLIPCGFFLVHFSRFIFRSSPPPLASRRRTSSPSKKYKKKSASGKKERNRNNALVWSKTNNTFIFQKTTHPPTDPLSLSLHQQGQESQHCMANDEKREPAFKW